MIISRNKYSTATIYLTLSILLVLSLLPNCKKLDPERVVKVKTGSVTDISYTTCKVGGTILDIGKNGIDEYGFCWSLSQQPTFENDKIQLGAKNSIGVFSSNLTDLSVSTKYYIRAYAKNSDGITYGEQDSFVTINYSKPTLTTSSISNITENSAESGGDVTDDGGSSVTARGVCWSTSPNPTIASSKTANGSGTGNFTSILENLMLGTTYYVRAYATNIIGTEFGNEISFTTNASPPSATTTEATLVTNTTATLNGTVNANSVTTSVTFEYGLTTAYGNTAVATPSTATGNTATVVSASLTGLTAGTTYHFRVKAVSNGGTTYGDDINFATISASPTVTDIDGNIYNIITIGTQTWMAENLKTTKYNDNTTIPIVANNTAWNTLTTPAYCWYNNDATTYKATYGALYNWYAVDARSNGGKNVCPTGWHVPTNAEWTTLTTYLGGESVASGKLKETGTTHWTTPNVGATNETGFSALPGGYRYYNGLFYNVGSGGYWWSSTENSITLAWFRHMDLNSASVYTNFVIEQDGFSVRCVKD